MKQQVVYNLEEFATKYHLNDIFGAYAAHFSIGAAYSSIIEIDATAPTNTDFYAMVQERTLFTKLLLVKQGQCQLQLLIIEAKKSLQASSSIRCACRLLLYIYIKNSDSYPFYIFHQQFNHQFPSFPLKSNHSPLFWRGAGGEASWG